MSTIPRQHRGRLQPAPAPLDEGSRWSRREPLALCGVTQGRMRAAVQALLDVSGLNGAPDPVRLAAVVLASRVSVECGTGRIRAAELGRWIGLSRSRVHSEVLPWLSRAGVVRTWTVEGEFGQHEAIGFSVTPLVAAHGVGGHPLNLDRRGFAVLLRLLEAVMAPGWQHRDGSSTPAGLMGDRAGRGAGTDRLALLLLVLEAAPSGRVRLCGGAADPRRGRLATTLARLLDCTPARAERVLDRLEEAGLVQRARRATGSGMRQRSRLVVPAVAAAHGLVTDGPGPAAAAPAGAPGRPTPGEQQEQQGLELGGEVPEGDFADPDDAAGPIEPAAETKGMQVSALAAAGMPESADPDDAAALHTDHPHVAEDVEESADGGGFSGEAPSGCGGRPGRAGGREDQAVLGAAAAVGTTPSGGGGDPLRGEQHNNSQVAEANSTPRAASRTAKTVPGLPRQRPATSLPHNDRLRTALAPASVLWAQLSNPQQRMVLRAVEQELAALSSMLGTDAAPAMLANRLADRLEESGGEAFVRDATGWLIGRGLVRRPACSDERCDDGIRLDTGSGCPTCDNVIHIRRARRARTAAAIDQRMPHAEPAARRRALEAELRRQTALEAEDFAWRREQAEARRAALEEAARSVRAREAEQRAEREARRCADCGTPRSGGLCEACGYHRQAKDLVEEAGLVAATWSADLGDPADVAAVADHVRQTLEREVAMARQEFLNLMDPAELAADPQAATTALAFNALQAVQQAAPEYRRCALEMLGRTSDADAEAERSYAVELRRYWWHPEGETARTAAGEAAEAARARTAQHLLDQRLQQLRGVHGDAGAATAGPVEAGAPAPRWADRLARLASHPLPGESEVIA